MSTLRTAVLSLALASLYAAPVAAQSPQLGTAGTPSMTEKRHINVAQNGFAEVNQRPEIEPMAPEKIAFANGFKPRTVIVDTAARKLYFTLSSKEAYVYPVAVGKPGFAWAGVETVTGVANWPDWVPPAEMRQRKPTLPQRMAGGINNPLGAKAIYLGNTVYRIHGTSAPASIGSAASSGCIRMLNGHVVHLSKLLARGTKVFVMEQLPASGPAMPPAVMKSATIIDTSSHAEVSTTATATPVQLASR